MAELTNLETKLGEVLGLAMVAPGATEKVKKLDNLDGELAKAPDLKTLNERARNSGVQELGEWGTDPAAPLRAGPAGFPEACSGGRPERDVLSWARPLRPRSASPVAGAAPSVESPRNRSFLRRLRRHWRPGVTRSRRRSQAAISAGL
jgi:hypothetical protein